MMYYLLKTTPSNKYTLELYGNDTLRSQWTNWRTSESEAMTSKLQKAWSTNITIEERISNFNDARKKLDGATLVIHATFTTITHPELFI